MLNINKKKLHIQDYIIIIQFLERYINNFFI